MTRTEHTLRTLSDPLTVIDSRFPLPTAPATVAVGTPVYRASKLASLASRREMRAVEAAARLECLRDVAHASMIKRACRGDVTAAMLLLTLW